MSDDVVVSFQLFFLSYSWAVFFSYYWMLPEQLAEFDPRGKQLRLRVWSPLDFYEVSWSPSKSFTTTQSLLKSHEIFWSPVKSFEVYWSPLNSHEVSLSLLKFLKVPWTITRLTFLGRSGDQSDKESLFLQVYFWPNNENLCLLMAHMNTTF